MENTLEEQLEDNKLTITTAKVDDIEYVIGGWAEYELNKRVILNDSRYVDRKYVTTQEIVDDLLASTKKYILKPVTKAANNLYAILKEIEESNTISRGSSIPAMTAEEIISFSNFLKEEDWANYLKYIEQFSHNIKTISGDYYTEPPNNINSKELTQYININELQTAQQKAVEHIHKLENVLKWLAEQMDYSTKKISNKD